MKKMDTGLLIERIRELSPYIYCIKDGWATFYKADGLNMKSKSMLYGKENGKAKHYKLTKKQRKYITKTLTEAYNTNCSLERKHYDLKLMYEEELKIVNQPLKCVSQFNYNKHPVIVLSFQNTDSIAVMSGRWHFGATTELTKDVNLMVAHAIGMIDDNEYNHQTAIVLIEKIAREREYVLSKIDDKMSYDYADMVHKHVRYKGEL